jgi:formate hydrogenlyase transcriptional activator
MSLSTKPNHQNEIPLNLSTLLADIMEREGAIYIQLIFEPFGSERFHQSSYHSKISGIDNAFTQSVKNFAERTKVRSNGSGATTERISRISDIPSVYKSLLSDLVFIPIDRYSFTMGILILGFKEERKINIKIGEDLLRSLIGVLKRNEEQVKADREKVYSLARSFISVHEPRQMEYILKYQINGIFNLESSTIICPRAAQHTRDFLFYLPNDFTKRSTNSLEFSNPIIINADTDKYLYEFLEKANENEIYSRLDLDKYTTRNEIHPYLKLYHKRGGRSVYAIHLLRENVIIGFWLVLPEEGTEFNFNPGLLEPMIAQLASTVHNIALYAELADKKKESEILLSLNMDLAATRDKNNLLKLIRTRLQKLFKFSHHFVCKINDDDMTVSLMLSDSQSRSQYHPYYESVKLSKFPITDGIYNKVLLSSEPIVFDLGKLSERGPLPLHLQVNFDSGIKKVVMLALRVDSKIQGIWTIAFTLEQLLQPKYLEIIKSVAAPISIAVANIRINDSLMEREAERDKLMSMSFELTTTRNKEELIQTLDQFLPKLLNYQSLSIFVDDLSHVNGPFLYLSKVTELADKYAYGREECGTEIPFDCLQTFDSPEVTLTELQPLIMAGQELGWPSSEYAAGARSIATIELRNDNRRIGILAVFLTENMAFSEHQQNILKEVSYQISTAISDIQYNEDLKRRDQEKELLLALSEDIAAVRDKDNLINVIKNRLKPILRFSHFALGVKVSDNSIISFLSDPDSKAKNHPSYTKVFRQEKEYCEDFIEFINQSATPLIFNPTNITGFSQVPEVMLVNFESGIKVIAITKLSDGVSIFGYCFFFYDQADIVSPVQFGLLKGIANQFSTAIFNIKANLENINREKENELLISLSNTTAGIRCFDELMELITTKFRNVFAFQTCFIGMLVEDGKSFKILPGGNVSRNASADLLPDKECLHIPFGPDLHLHLMKSSSPLILDLKTEHRMLLPGLEKDYNYQYAVMTRFMHGDKLLGIWLMFYESLSEIDTRLFRLLQGINDQLSNSVANILANEKLSHNEMQKSMLLSFSKHISTARNPTDLISTVAQDLKPALNFYHTIIVLFNEERDHVYPWILASESKAKDHPDYQSINRLTPVDQVVDNIVLASSRSYLVDLANFPATQVMPDYLRVNYESGINYVLFVKLVVRNELIGFWNLWFVEKPGINPKYLELVEEVAKIMATTISNISFNDIIKKRDKEKTSLLEFTQAIAGVRDKFELRKIFNQYLKNLCFIDDICLSWFSEDKKSQGCYFWDDTARNAKDPEFQKLISVQYPIDDTVFSCILNSRLEQTFTLSELLNLPNALGYIRFLCKQNCEKIVGVPLFKGKDIVGVLFVKEFNVQTADQPLFRGLCTQLAIAVSNLIANEKVMHQLSEINMYKERLEEEKIYLKQELETTHNYAEIVGESKEIRSVFHMVSQVAGADSTVLILGETGTGKELVARAIHNNSPRKNKLLVKVNCAALPANLIESELFGHEKGSFTGATERRVGKFELANGGSLFLDEIGEMPLELQVKLLRALQEREIERVGGRGPIKVDVRIIAATNRNLEQEIISGNFRSDLYFRLSTFPIALPSLKERRIDIPILASHFVSRFAKKAGKAIDTISQRAMQELVNYNWPGNVRELEHQIERSVLMTQGSTIKTVFLPAVGTINNTHSLISTDDSLVIRTIDENERDLIIRTLKYTDGKVSGPNGAAELLGVPSTTLNAKMKRLNIKKNFSR